MGKAKTRFSPKIVMAAVLLVAAVAAGVVWLTRNNKPQPQPQPQPYAGPVAHVSTGVVGEYASLILIAQHQGYFKSHGLDVAIKEYPSGPASLSALLQGKVDMAMASDFAGVSDSFNGQDLKILANMSTSQAFYMVGLKNHGISQVGDLKGKRIGITRGTVGEYYLGQFLTFNKLPLQDVTLVNMPQANLVQAAAQGKVDAAVLFEPNAYLATKALGSNAVRWSVQSGQSIYSLLYSTGDFTRQQPQVIRRYLQATLMAETFISQHPARARQIIAGQLGYTQAYIDYIWPRFTFSMSLDEGLLINMNDEARWAIENHVTTAAAPPNYFNLIYFNGLQAVKPEGITIIR